jgi:hypothetical protein
MENNNVPEIIQNHLGKIFLHRNSYCAPDVVRIVGFTPSCLKEKTKIRYVFVEYIDISQFTIYTRGYGGECNIDLDLIPSIQTPVIIPYKTINKLKFNIEEPNKYRNTIWIYLSEGSSKSSDYKVFNLFEEGADATSPCKQKLTFCEY